MVLKAPWAAAMLIFICAAMSAMAAAEELPMYAGKEPAINCLAKPMPVPFDQHFTYLQLRSGAVTCPHNCPGDAPESQGCLLPGKILAGTIISMHIFFCTIPLIAIAVFCRRFQNQTKAKAFNVLLTGLGIFLVAFVAETCQHVYDNWLDLGLIPTYMSAIFYGSLTLGQAVLAWGLCGLDWHSVADVSVAVASFITLLAAAFHATDAPLPTSGPWSIAVKLTFVCTTLTTSGFIIKSFMAFGGARVRSNWVYCAAVVVCYGVGIYLSSYITSTGNQWWHVPNAMGTVGGFVFEIFWMAAGMAAKDKVRKD